MLYLRELTIRGFRGFLAERRFRFDFGLTLLYGPNAAGKSSTVNAIEWCLFGDDCKGKQTSIRERVGWEVGNRQQRPADVLVELRLQDETGDWTIRRTLSKPAGKRTVVEGLEFSGPGGVWREDDAIERLARLLRCTFRDFMTTVHQHQESIRDSLTREPRERDDAIDRLLGLSEYRNLQSGIQAVNPKTWVKELGRRLESLEQRVKLALGQRSNDLDAKRKEAAEAGVLADQLTADAALAAAGEAATALRAFADDAGIDVPALPAANPAELRAFERALLDQVAQLRSRLPAAKEEGELLARRRQVESLVQDGKSAREKLATARQALNQVEVKPAEDVAERIRSATAEQDEQKAKLKQADRKSALLQDAVDFLQVNAGELGCPVCERESPDLLTQVRARLEENRVRQHAGISERLGVLERQLRDLRLAEDEQVRACETRQRLEEDVQRCEKKLEELRKNEAELRGGRSQAELGNEEESWLTTERQRIDARLEELRLLVQEKQARLNAIAGRVERIKVIRESLQIEEKKGQIMAIKQAAEFQSLQGSLDQASQLAGHLERIKEAVAAASQEEANQRLTAARQHISSYFQRLSAHSEIREIKIELSSDARSGRNSYALTDTTGLDLVPVLSQGDMNVLALAIFLGLASAGQSGFGFVLLDDPSQSLGSGHKQRLAELLAEQAKKRQVVVATMDQEFREVLKGRAGENLEYHFAEWTPTGVTLVVN